ncbi:serine/threonine-protein kinase [Streptomyces longwoodensis]|uniref:serine/threonine-protein kinase n=1 Tax=Streptomyces longwoodensis TaxID=68231 RepID=UPI003696FC2D
MAVGGPGGQFRPLESGDPASVASYRLAARLGSGGMGTVYLSYTPGGHPIALKTIRPELSEDPEFRRRFRQEVEAAKRVQGLYTAPVIDYDVDGTRPWLATAYVPGPSLAAAVAEHGPLPAESVLLLLAGTAEALSVIHGAGIVHRDLKPSNVLLAADGPRVIDFGIARAADATALTGTGISVGTPAFMSPEQAAGKAVTPASDVFALGQVAAFAGRGQGAYGDGPSHAVLYRIVHEEPDLEGLPEQLRFVRECLAKDPARRPTPARIVELCQEASPTPLRQSGSWLPAAIAADITQRVSASAALAAAPKPAPAGPPPTAPLTHLSPASPASAASLMPPPPTHAAPTATAGHVPSTPAPGYGPPPVPHTPAPGFGPPTGPRPPFGQQPGWRPAPLPPRRNRAGKWIGIGIAAVAAFVWLSSCASILLDITDKADDGGATSSSTSSPVAGDGARPLPDPKPVTYKGVDLPEGYYVRFADSPPKPLSYDGRTEGVDLYYYEDDLGSSGDRIVLLNNSQQGSLATCRQETRYAAEVTLSQLSAGTRLCVHTRSGHIALVTYRRSAPENDPSDFVSVDLTIWRNAEEPTTG